MQLLGIGFSSYDWNILIKQLQINVSIRLNTKLYEVVNSASETKNWLKDIETLSEDIIDHNPDWLLFNTREFESAENCLDLLNNVQNKSVKRVSLVMVIQSIQEELYSILNLKPTFELVNQMRFKISAKELLLDHHILRFPRIALNSKFKAIEYVSDSGSVLKQSLDEISLNTIIPYKNIRKIHTNKDQLSPGQSIKMLLNEHNMKTDPKEVVGILREKKACYLFPGIPFDSIKNITFEKIRIEHLIKLDECTEKNPPFKRFIAGLLKDNDGKNKQKKAKVKHSSLKILCLCKYSIVSNLMEKLLNRIGYVNLVTVEGIKPEDDNLNNSAVLLKFQDCDVFNFKGQILDWCEELNQILEPISQFVFLNDIRSSVKTEPSKLQQFELEDLKRKLLENEKAALKLKKHAERDHLLYSQEYEVLKNIESFASLLSDALSKSTNWESADKDASKIKLQRALLICEGENDASEMNYKLNNVQQKLWVNPFSIQKPEDLTQLKSKIIHSYLDSGSLIIKPTALKHLKKICMQTKHELKNAEKTFKKQKIILKKTKTELEMIESNKNKLALSWLETNLKKLLFRDLQLLQLDSGMVE